MKACLAACALAILLASAARNRDAARLGTGVPEPPFEGAIPEDAYLYNGEPGAYGGTLATCKRFDVPGLNREAE